MTTLNKTILIEEAITEINENDARADNDFIRECCKKYGVSEKHIRKVADIRLKYEL